MKINYFKFIIVTTTITITISNITSDNLISHSLKNSKKIFVLENLCLTRNISD